MLTCAAEDARWPGFMGAQRNGWVKEFQPPAEWPKELKKHWNLPVGTGYGSPLVSGGRVYQHARQGEEEVLWCLDLATGEELWRKGHAAPFEIGQGGQKHGKGPKSSPVLADGRVFTLGIAGVLHAWDAESGSLLWQRDYAAEFQPNQPYWGVSSSPLVDGDRLIVHLGNDERGALLALNVRTGKEIWRQGKQGASYSSPLLVEIAGVRQIVQWNHEDLVGVESASGRLLWSYHAPHRGNTQNMPTPVLAGDRLLLGGENRGIQGLRPQVKAGEWTVEKLWHQNEVALDMSTAVMNGDFLYGMSHHKIGQLFCLAPADGAVRWLGPPKTGENVAFLAIPGHVVALIHTGELRIVKASADGYQAVASYRLSEGETWAPPVLLKDGILIKDEEMLTLWSF